MDVVTLRDQMVRVERFSCVFFTAMAGNKAGTKNQGAYMQFYVPSHWKRWVFQGRKQDFNLALGMNNKICSR